MEIYLIRHTTPEVEKGICYGQTDVPLKTTFYQEREIILTNLPNTIEVIYSSPLNRCSRLANFLAKQFAVSVIFDSRLTELNFGDWEMQKWDDINQGSLQHWMNDYVNVSCPSGESYRQLAMRGSIFLDDLRTLNKKSVAIVTHHGVMKAVYALANNLTLEAAMEKNWPYGYVYQL